MQSFRVNSATITTCIEELFRIFTKVKDAKQLYKNEVTRMNSILQEILMNLITAHGADSPEFTYDNLPEKINDLFAELNLLKAIPARPATDDQEDDTHLLDQLILAYNESRTKANDAQYISATRENLISRFQGIITERQGLLNMIADRTREKAEIQKFMEEALEI